jgi:TPR repeat protein
LALTWSCLLGVTTYAGSPLQDAQAAYDRGRYAAALELWQPLAEDGNPDAQVGLGSLYLGGYGATKDEAVALAWFLRFARLYSEGLGVSHDDVQAFKWFAIAAERGLDSYSRTNAAQGRDATAPRLTTDQIAQARRLARAWKPRSER